MTTPGRTNRGQTVVAALQTQGVDLRVLTASVDHGAVRVLDARTLPASTPPAQLAQTLTGLGVTRVLRIVPASRSIAKADRVPAGSLDEMKSAADLLAEVSLPEDCPPHRRAAGITPRRTDENAWVVFTAWNGAAIDAPVPGIRTSWTTEPAALLGLIGGGEGVAVVADRSAGGIAIAASGESGVIARTIIEDASDPAWGEHVAAQVRAAARAAGLANAPQFQDAPRVVALSSELLASLSSRHGRIAEPGFLPAHGVCLGAAMLAADHAGLAPLTELQDQSEESREPSLVRAARWTADPKRAWKLAAAGLALALIAPIVTAKLREQVLKYKAGPLLAQAEEQAKRDRRAALYGQLNKTRWPMTKLMAELAASTPVGINVDRVVLSPEAEYGLSISGTADSLDSLEQLQANLNRTGLISSLKADKTEAASNGVSFTRSAKVSDPLVKATLADDFAVKSLRDRIYNEDGTRIRNSAARIDDAPDTASDRGEDRPRSGPRSAPSTPKAAASLAPLSDADIAAMDYATAMKEWSARLGPSRTDPDPTVKARLAEEVKKLDTQRKKAKANPPAVTPAPAPKPAEATPAAEGTPAAQPSESAPATPPPPPPAESERPASTGGVA